MGRNWAEATKALVSRMLRGVGLAAYFGLRRFAAVRPVFAGLAWPTEVFFGLAAGLAAAWVEWAFRFAAVVVWAGTWLARAIARARPHFAASRTLAVMLKYTSLRCMSLLKTPTVQL